jgi:hypothetical protein
VDNPFDKTHAGSGTGIRDISAVLEISVQKVLQTLVSATYELTPKRKHYDRLEIDEFWTYVGKKRTKYGLYTPTTGETGRWCLVYGGNGTYRRRKSRGNGWG